MLKLHPTPTPHPSVTERAWCIWQPFCDCEDSQPRTQLTYTMGRTDLKEWQRNPDLGGNLLEEFLLVLKGVCVGGGESQGASWVDSILYFLSLSRSVVSSSLRPRGL